MSEIQKIVAELKTVRCALSELRAREASLVARLEGAAGLITDALGNRPPPLRKGGSITEAIVLFVESAGHPVAIPEIADGIGHDRDRTARLLHRAAGYGRVRRVRHGRYAPAGAP